MDTDPHARGDPSLQQAGNEKGQLSLELILIVAVLLISGLFAIHYLTYYFPYNYQKNSENDYYNRVKDYENVQIFAWVIRTNGSYTVALKNSYTPHTVIINNVSATIGDVAIYSEETKENDVPIPPGDIEYFHGYGFGDIDNSVDVTFRVNYTDSMSDQQFYMRITLQGTPI